MGGKLQNPFCFDPSLWLETEDLEIKLNNLELKTKIPESEHSRPWSSFIIILYFTECVSDIVSCANIMGMSWEQNTDHIQLAGKYGEGRKLNEKAKLFCYIL